MIEPLDQGFEVRADVLRVEVCSQPGLRGRCCFVGAVDVVANVHLNADPAKAGN